MSGELGALSSRWLIPIKFRIVSRSLHSWCEFPARSTVGDRSFPLSSLAVFPHTLVVSTNTVPVLDVSLTHDTAPAARKCPRTPSLVRIPSGSAAPCRTPTRCSVLPARRCRSTLVVDADPPWIRRPSSRCVDTSIHSRSRPRTPIPFGSCASLVARQRSFPPPELFRIWFWTAGRVGSLDALALATPGAPCDR